MEETNVFYVFIFIKKRVLTIFQRFLFTKNTVDEHFPAKTVRS